MLQKGTVPCPKCGSVAEACVRYFGDDIGGRDRADTGTYPLVPQRRLWLRNPEGRTEEEE